MNSLTTQLINMAVLCGDQVLEELNVKELWIVEGDQVVFKRGKDG